MSRGDRREAIFRDDHDRRTFLETLAQMCTRTSQRVHSYVLMSNHYHLLLETPEANLVAGMQWLQGTYTQRHNVRHRHGGHLFQGRYKAVPVDSQPGDYFQTVSDYIHLNPARARMLASPVDELLGYCWSSYPAFVQKARLPTWLCRQRVFGYLALKGDGARARRRYQGLSRGVHPRGARADSERAAKRTLAEDAAELVLGRRNLPGSVDGDGRHAG